MRHLIVAFSFVVASGLFSAASAQPPSSPNTDRPGGDYSNFEIGAKNTVPYAWGAWITLDQPHL